jgi:hypothetical protein
MLTIRQPKTKVLERIIRAKTGEFVLATFLVVEYQGQVRAKLLSIAPLTQEQAEFQASAIKALPAPLVKTVFEKVLTFGEEIISPFVDFSFFVSQPTRAPSFSL